MNDEPTVLDLFSGIGGFSLAFESVGFKTIGFAEIDPYASAVLKKHWPGAPNYGDVRTITKGLHLNPAVVTGGFPCQPFSVAGERRGDSDERFLWPECVRIVRELRPAFALFENVPGITTIDGGRTFNRVLADLSSVGYDCLWNCVPACAVGAPHRRDRIWILCHAKHVGRDAAEIGKGDSQRNDSDAQRQESAREFTGPSGAEVLADATSGRQQKQREQLNSETRFNASSSAISNAAGEQTQRQGQPRPLTESACRGWWDVEPDVGRVANGIPNRTHSLKGLGNSIVPQVAQIFALAIYQHLTTQNQ